jgi:L-threonylcarbamoyladenylate synthase
MRSEIIRVNPEKIEPDKIGRISTVLKSGGLIVYPTETFYGLGADCYSAAAAKRIYSLKERAAAKPLSVVVSDIDMLRDITAVIPPKLEELVSPFWPGPLTIVLTASEKVPRVLLGGGSTIGVRLPGSEWLRQLVHVAGFPITATSANVSGTKELSQSEEVISAFAGKVDLIVDGGKTPGMLPSTVIGLSSARLKILREGVLPASEIHEQWERIKD